MKTEYMIGGAVFVFFLAMGLSWAYELPTTKNMIPAFVLIGLVGGGGYALYKLEWVKFDRGIIKSSREAVEYAQQEWKIRKHEELLVEFFNVTSFYFTSEDGKPNKWYAIRGNPQSGGTVILNVQANPKDISIEESPTPRQIQYPWLALPYGRFATPIGDMKFVISERDIREKEKDGQTFNIYPSDDLEKIRGRKDG